MPENKAIDKHVLGNQVTQGDLANGAERLSEKKNMSMYVLGNQVTQGGFR